jgi:hypothetical protein
LPNTFSSGRGLRLFLDTPMSPKRYIDPISR